MKRLYRELDIDWQQSPVVHDYQSGHWFDAFAGDQETYWMKKCPEIQSQTFLSGRLSRFGKIDFFMLKLSPGKKIRWHIDHNREASVVFPLTPDSSVQIYDDKRIYEYFYSRRPLLLNVKKKHRVLNSTSQERYALYASIYDLTYEECAKQLGEQGALHVK